MRKNAVPKKNRTSQLPEAPTRSLNRPFVLSKLMPMLGLKLFV